MLDVIVHGIYKQTSPEGNISFYELYPTLSGKYAWYDFETDYIEFPAYTYNQIHEEINGEFLNSDGWKMEMSSIEEVNEYLHKSE